MLTMRAAAALLSTATSTAAMAEMLRALGLISADHAPDDEAIEALGLDGTRDTRLAASGTSSRFLLVRFTTDAPIRESLRRVTARLSARAPHVLWVIGALDASGSTAAIVAWVRGDGSPRIASFVWEPDRVLDSDAETLCALAALRRDDEGSFHERCVEVLGRDALTRRFYRVLEAQVGALAATAHRAVAIDDARAVSLLYVTRLLFLCFLEAKGWLDGDRAFVATRFDDCMRAGGEFHRRVLRPLFFGTLNTPLRRRARAARAFGRIPFLNGGLFTRAAAERRAGAWIFPDDALGGLMQQLFQRFRFVAREDSATWSEAAVDPEMLGRAFESLMSSSDRKAGGVFYTPHQLVGRVADEAVAGALASGSTSLHTLQRMRVLDPACGSGAFLVYVLEQLADRRRRLGETGSISSIRRDVLAASVFGVDRDPTAVWLCELRLWLSVVIESDETDPDHVPPLPNLDRNIRIGDALTGGRFAAGLCALEGGQLMRRLRARYVRATGARKQTLARALDREERRRAVAVADREIAALEHARREQLASLRGRDLFGQRGADGADATRERARVKERLRTARRERRMLHDGSAVPFSFGALFGEAQAAGGFDVVLGNPPWVRLHHIPPALRVRFKQTFQVYRGAPWSAGAAAARAATGFAAQVDLAALFVERAMELARPGGTVALLLPVKLWHSLAGGGVRRLLLERSRLIRIEDLSASRHAFDAAVYPSLLVTSPGEPSTRAVMVASHRGAAYREWRVAAAALAFDDTPGAPWMLLHPPARAAFDRLRDAGVPLASTHFGSPRLGVKSGCNAAFVVKVESVERDIAYVVDTDGERGKVEAALLRPALRGEGVGRWTRSPAEQWIIWTHDERGPLAQLPPHARSWLRRRYGALSTRADAGKSRRWWSLFRTHAGDPRFARVVWADFGRRPRALVLARDDAAVPLNTCYVIPCPDERDAWALAALMNSPLAAAWLSALAEPARGDYRRFMGWTVGQLPLPRDWTNARERLAAAAQEARTESDDRADALLHSAVLDAFGFRRGDCAALMEP